jgi:hypothetical protein
MAPISKKLPTIDPRTLHFKETNNWGTKNDRTELQVNGKTLAELGQVAGNMVNPLRKQRDEAIKEGKCFTIDYSAVEAWNGNSFFKDNAAFYKILKKVDCE